MGDEDLTAGRVLWWAGEGGQRILGVAVGPRPLLAIPHLLNQESAASYHGYLLANMAVYQTRAYFDREYGCLTDNPAIGPALAEHYWARGNGISNQIKDIERRHLTCFASLVQVTDHERIWRRDPTALAHPSERIYEQPTRPKRTCLLRCQ